MTSFRGVLVPALTPFNNRLEPDPVRYGAFCQWLLQQGAAGLAVFGTTSEANSLTVSERRELLDQLVEGGIPASRLMPGTGCCALPDSVALSIHAVNHGCGGVLVLPPFYYKGIHDDGLYAYYAELIERTADSRLQLYLYHIPQMSGVPISLPLIERLLKVYPNTVVGIKDSSGQWENTVQILRNFPELATFPSSESRLREAMQLGGAGCISATANINVAMIARLAADWQSDSAADLHDQVSSIRKVFEGHPLVPALKAAMAHYTTDVGWQTLRPPLSALMAGPQAALIKELDALKFALPPINS